MNSVRNPSSLQKTNNFDIQSIPLFVGRRKTSRARAQEVWKPTNDMRKANRQARKGKPCRQTSQRNVPNWRSHPKAQELMVTKKKGQQKTLCDHVNAKHVKTNECKTQQEGITKTSDNQEWKKPWTCKKHTWDKWRKQCQPTLLRH